MWGAAAQNLASILPYCLGGLPSDWIIDERHFGDAPSVFLGGVVMGGCRRRGPRRR